MRNRRSFLKTTAGALAVSPLATGQGRKIKIGLIGCGWYGMVDLNAAFKAGGVECLALCDVDSEHLASGAAEVEKLQGSKPKTFADYRELLDVPGLEAVLIGTPPHWHALQFIDACRKGLDVYCEKPLAYDVREGQAMVAAWKQAGNIVQVGFQRRKAPNYRAAREYVASGKAGRIVQVDVNINYMAKMLDATPQAPPATLDWDKWCGPSPKLPYYPNRGHKSWRLEAATGHGHLVDWGIHLIDATRVSLGLKMPEWVTAAGGLYQFKGQITTPDILTVHFEFKECPVIWRHRLWGAAEYDRGVANGIFFYGEKGTVFATDRRWVVVPQGREAEHQVREEKGEQPGLAHMTEFLESVRSRKQPSCRPDDAWLSTATVQLGMISYEVGARVDWDAAGKRITSGADAERLLKREYRAPYVHPYRG